MYGVSRNARLKLVGASLAALAVAGGGVAIAATKPWSPRAESQAVINDAAKQLGVTPTQLSNALKRALKNRVDDAVAAGLLTKAQGDALKKRIDSSSSDLPLRFGLSRFAPRANGFDFKFGLAAPFARFEAASSYLGLSESELQAQLAEGKTLAQVANDRGKSVDGLVDALVKAAEKQIDAAVASGKLTKSQADDLKAGLSARMTRLVNGELRFRRGPGPFAPGFGFGFGFRGHLLPMKPSSAPRFRSPSGPSA